MGDEFDDFVVEVEEGNEDKHDRHVDEEREDATRDEFEKLGDDMCVFDLEDKAAVREIGKEDGNNPGNDVGDLEFEGVVGIEESEDEGIVGAEADEGGEDADDKIANDLGIFGVFGLEEAAEFSEGHFWMRVRLVSRVI